MRTSFSVADAKRANLWGKKGPWTQYPARMLKWRARGFNLADNFGEVLKGLKTIDELMDTPAEPLVTSGRLEEPAPVTPQPQSASPASGNAAEATTPERQKRVDEISALVDGLKLDWVAVRSKLQTKYGFANLQELTNDQQNEVLESLKKAAGQGAVPR
jgi:hypothetical protein